MLHNDYCTMTITVNIVNNVVVSVIILGSRLGDCGRRSERPGRELQIAVVLHEPHKQRLRMPGGGHFHTG